MLSSKSFFLTSLGRILRPVVRFCLRHALHFQDLQDLARRTFVEVAREEMERRGEKVNISRLSAATGLQRRDLMRLIDEEDSVPTQPQGLVNRVIGQWLYRKPFCASKGKPKVLDADGDQSDFFRLVRSVSNDIHPGTVLFELERIGAVERNGSQLRLKVSSYVPKADQKEQYRLLTSDTEDLITAVEENIANQLDIPHLHAKTEFDNIAQSHLPEIRAWILARGTDFHREIREFLAQFDVDINESLKGAPAGARVAVGAFSLTEEITRGGKK